MSRKNSDKLSQVVIMLISLVIVIFLFMVVYANPWGSPRSSANFSCLPTVNAAFNALTSLFLILGVVSVKRKQVKKHKVWMASAGVSSVCFLVSYLIYHSLYGNTLFPPIPLIRPIYLILLFSHISLSVVALPLILYTYYLAWKKDLARHRKIAKYTFPIWLYVSASGVIVYILLQTYL